MKLIDRDNLFGEPVKGALERILAGAVKGKKREDSARQSTPTPAINISDPSRYIILPGRKHGSYEYPDFLASMHRLSYDSDVEKAAKQLDFEAANTASEQDGTQYIGNINWEKALKLNAQLGNATLTLRQFIDFKELLEAGIDNKSKVYNGAGKELSASDIHPIYNEIFEVREPWRSESLDASFKDEGNGLLIMYNHLLKNGNLAPDKKEALESHAAQDSWIDAKSFNNQGLPTKKSKAQKLYYWAPMDGRVAGFGADSGWAFLYCYGGPSYADASLGVRAARAKN